MGSQGVVTRTRTIRINGGGSDKENGKSLDGKKSATKHAAVTVAPHTRMVKGKPVFVAGYSYKR